MSHKFISTSSFHAFLMKCDQDIANEVIQAGCLSCGGKLHSANYPRSPFGVPQPLRRYYHSRFSFCCSQCRKRTTAPSLRFFGRRWYIAPFLLLICALTCKSSQTNCSRIKKCFGLSISLRTWKRWRYWWREYFITTPFWLQERGKLSANYQAAIYPYCFFCLFSGNLQQRLILLLHFLMPMTAGILRAV